MVPDFGLSTPLAKFWTNYILPLSYYSDSVKHATIALGVVHRAFLGGSLNDIRPYDSAMALNDLATRHHRKAVSETIRIMNDPSPVNIRITLVCCLVFVCFEIVGGQYDKAIQHLKSGSKVLKSLYQAAICNKSDPASVSPYDKCLAATVHTHFDQLCDIANMFTSIGMDASMLTESGTVSDLSFFSQPDTNNDRNKPFLSVSEARHRLHFVELMFLDAFDSVCSSEERLRSISSHRSKELSPPSNGLNEDERKRALDHFDVWCARFKIFQERLPVNIGPADLEEVKSLRFSQRSWEVFHKHDGPFSLRNSNITEFHALVDLAEDMFLSNECPLRPTFTLAAHVIPTMAYLCGFCNNLELEQRIIKVLRRMRRREGIWDSRQMADLYESFLQAKRASKSTWEEDILHKESLPSLARKLSDLSISEKGRITTYTSLALL
ncbi:C6 zinc finger domain protein [Colletotrichum tofieldiae]|uniref:C6 zinc finger domain protein n=1 Tax=Colletotrichum tofieldiae TaxID=708197 RepID=A0A166RJB3_9PEZI|nr:C6 zinc finger domain protein [Colletotrichum tofieldiae]